MLPADPTPLSSPIMDIPIKSPKEVATSIYENIASATISFSTLAAEITSLIRTHYEYIGTSEPNDNEKRNSFAKLTGKIQSRLYQCTNQFLILKNFQRHLCLMIGDSLSNQVMNTRTKDETLNLQLQNLIYERNNLIKEIKSLKKFKHNFLIEVARQEANFDDGDEFMTTTAECNDNNFLIDDFLRRTLIGSNSSEDQKCEDNFIIKMNEEDGYYTEKLVNNDLSNPSLLSENQEVIPHENKNPNNNHVEREEYHNSYRENVNDNIKIPYSRENYSHFDPKYHRYNLSRLYIELKQRKNLEIQLEVIKFFRNEKERNLRKNVDFLSKFHENVNQLEKSSIPLQDCIYQSSNVEKYHNIQGSHHTSKQISTEVALKCVGTGRMERLHKASNLPMPLYTIFYQLQFYIDAFDHHEVTLDVVSSKKSSSSFSSFCDDFCIDDIEKHMLLMKDKHAIQLSFPTPNHTSLLEKLISWENETVNRSYNTFKSMDNVLWSFVDMESTDKVVKIQLEYLPMLNIVTAKADCSMLVNQNDNSALLFEKFMDNIYEDDDGTIIPYLCCSYSYFVQYRINENMLNGRFTEIKKENLVQNRNKQMKDNNNDLNNNRKIQDLPKLMDLPVNSESDTTRSALELALGKVQRTLTHGCHGAKAYCWCQYIAGLYHCKVKSLDINSVTTDNTSANSIQRESSTHQQEAENAGYPCHYTTLLIEPITRIVLLQLRRRIRSYVTLASSLYFLEFKKPKTIPVHPSVYKYNLNTNDSDMTELENFTKNLTRTSNEKSVIIYDLVLKRKAIRLHLYVKIDFLYPSKLPKWSLYQSDSQSDFQNTITQLNQMDFFSLLSPTYLSHIFEKTSLPNSLKEIIRNHILYINENIPSKKYDEISDWLFFHQLSAVLISWDDLQKSKEINSNINDASHCSNTAHDMLMNSKGSFLKKRKSQ